MRALLEGAEAFADLPARISVSAGVAEYGLDISDQEDLLRVADAALYEAKLQHPSGVVVKRQTGHVRAPAEAGAQRAADA